MARAHRELWTVTELRTRAVVCRAGRPLAAWVVDLVKSGFHVASSKSDFLAEVPSERFSSLLAGASRDNLKPAIREQQDNINWATHVIVFGPVWYHGLPSCYYAYYERVFTLGWSFDAQHNWARGFFSDKKAMIVVTAAAPGRLYTRAGGFTLEWMLFPVHARNFRYNGFQILRSQGFYGISGMTH